MEDGSVVLTSTPTPLTYTPDKWLDIEVNRQRNQKYFGIERSFTAPLNFVKDGGLILKYFFYNAGVEDKLYLLIAEKRLYVESGSYIQAEQYIASIDAESSASVIETESLPGYYYYYSAIYKGEIDFSQFRHAGPKVTLNIMEGGASKLLKANENTKYTIPITAENSVLVRFDGIKLTQSATWIAGGIQRDSHTVPMIAVTQDSISSIGAIQQDIARVANVGADLWAAGERFLNTGSRESVVTLNYDFKVSASASFEFGDNNGVLELQMIILRDGGSVYSQEILQQFTGTINSFQNTRFQGTKTFTATANSRVILYMYLPLYATEITLTYDSVDSLFTAAYTYTHQQSYCLALRPQTLYKALCAKMGITPANSAYLDRNKQLLITSGDAIRQFQNAAIVTSFNDFFTSINAVLSVGIGIVNNRLVLEHKSFFASYNNPISLGECKDLKVSVATEIMFNTVKVGYPVQEYEDVNGRYEFNNTHTYSTPHTRITKELDLTSVYRADSYGIEFTRINLEGKTSTDDKSDSDNFFVHVKAKPATGTFVVFEYYDLERSLNASATGLPETQTIFNLWLSPKRNLLRNGAYIRSCFYKQDGEKIKFQATQKASTLVCGGITESTDVEIGDLDAPLFQPILMEFENKNPVNILDLLKADPGACFHFTNEGVNYNGLTMKSSVKPASREAQSFQLLVSPQANLAYYLTDYDG